MVGCTAWLVYAANSVAKRSTETSTHIATENTFVLGHRRFGVAHEDHALLFYSENRYFKHIFSLHISILRDDAYVLVLLEIVPSLYLVSVVSTVLFIVNLFTLFGSITPANRNK